MGSKWPMSFANIGRNSWNCGDIRSHHNKGKLSVTSASAALPLWAATSRNATNARIASSPTTLAAIGMVPSVRHSPGSVARREGQGTAPRAVLSRRVYHPRTACATGFAKPAGLLQFVVPGGVRDAAANRCRSPASGSEDRLSGGATHLEPEPAASSPCPLCRAGRWIVSRRVSMDSLPPEVLSARAGLEQAVSWEIAGLVAPGFRRGHFGILRAVSRSRRACSIPCVASEIQEDRVGRLRQTAVRRTGARLEVPRPLYAPSGHLQQSPAVARQWPGHFSVARLQTRQSHQVDDP